MRFAEVNDLHHAFTMFHKGRQVKNESVQFYKEILYALANDAFTKVDKAVVESQLVGLFIDGLYHDFLCMKLKGEKPKAFQAAVQSALVGQNLRKRFHLRSNDHHHPDTRIEEPMEINHIRTWRKIFLCCKGGHLAKHCKSTSVDTIAQVRKSDTDEVHFWRYGEVGHLKRSDPKNSRYQYQHHT